MHYLRRHVLGLVAERVDNHSAAHRTVRTSGAGLRGPCYFQFLGLSVCALEIEAQNGSNRPSGGHFDERPSGLAHETASMAHVITRCKLAARIPSYQLTRRRDT